MPLITHQIGAEVCLARQGANFHKCHRCIYRGQTSGWEPDEPQEALLVRVPEERSQSEVKQVVIPRPAAAAKRTAANG